jgi:hypothetical protein
VLLDDRDPAVRSWAASHALEFAPSAGEPVFEGSTFDGRGAGLVEWRLETPKPRIDISPPLFSFTVGLNVLVMVLLLNFSLVAKCVPVAGLLWEPSALPL